jgi:hypothetical protein
MKEKILQEALAWYENQKGSPDIEDFVDLVIHKTADAILDEIKNELKGEFDSGDLKHNLIISSDYYLDLKLKGIQEKYTK